MATKEKKKKIIRVDFTNQDVSKYFNDSCIIKEPAAYTEEEQKILKELQKQKISYRVTPFYAMTFKQKMEIMSQVMDIMHNMVIYEIEEEDGIS